MINGVVKFDDAERQYLKLFGLLHGLESVGKSAEEIVRQYMKEHPIEELKAKMVTPTTVELPVHLVPTVFSIPTQ